MDILSSSDVAGLSHQTLMSRYRPNDPISKIMKQELLKLNDERPRLFNQVRGAFLDLFNQYIDMFVYEQKMSKNMMNEVTEDADGKYIYRELLFDDKNLDIYVDIDYISNGALRLLWMLTKAALASLTRQSLLAFEELETGIHPSLIGKFLEAVDSLSKDITILFTTHSTSIVHYIEPVSLYIGLPSPNGLATFKRLSKNGIKELTDRKSDYDTLGEAIFDHLSGDEEKSRVLERILI
jgi:hypothetical protein